MYQIKRVCQNNNENVKKWVKVGKRVKGMSKTESLSKHYNTLTP